jgi:hypothetical protein
MRIVPVPDARVNAGDRALWLTPPFDRIIRLVPVGVALTAIAGVTGEGARPAGAVVVGFAYWRPPAPRIASNGAPPLVRGALAAIAGRDVLPAGPRAAGMLRDAPGAPVSGPF